MLSIPFVSKFHGFDCSHSETVTLRRKKVFTFSLDGNISRHNNTHVFSNDVINYNCVEKYVFHRIHYCVIASMCNEFLSHDTSKKTLWHFLLRSCLNQ